MFKRVLLTLAAIVLATYIIQIPSSPAPMDFSKPMADWSEDSPVDQGRAFMEARSARLDDAFEALESVVVEVSEGGVPGYRELRRAAVLYDISDYRPEEALRDLMQSPHGAYLSSEDEEFLRRTIDEFYADLRKRMIPISEVISRMDVSIFTMGARGSRVADSFVGQVISAWPAAEWINGLEDDEWSRAAQIYQKELESAGVWAAFCGEDPDDVASAVRLVFKPSIGVRQFIAETSGYESQGAVIGVFEAILSDALILSRTNLEDKVLRQLGVYSMPNWNRDRVQRRARDAIESHC